jgi:hypothetical protein
MKTEQERLDLARGYQVLRDEQIPWAGLTQEEYGYWKMFAIKQILELKGANN